MCACECVCVSVCVCVCVSVCGSARDRTRYKAHGVSGRGGSIVQTHQPPGQSVTDAILRDPIRGTHCIIPHLIRAYLVKLQEYWTVIYTAF